MIKQPILLLYPHQHIDHDYNDSIESTLFNNDKCYMSTSLMQSMNLVLGQSLMIQVLNDNNQINNNDGNNNNNNNNNNNITFISKCWTNRSITNDNYVQCNPIITLMASEKLKSIKYPQRIIIHPIPQQYTTTLLNKIDIQIIIDNKKNNNSTIPLSNQYIKEILKGKIITNGCLIGNPLNPTIKINRVELKDGNGNGDSDKIGLVYNGTEIYIVSGDELVKEIANNTIDRMRELAKQRRSSSSTMTMNGEGLGVGGLDSHVLALEELIIYPLLYNDTFKTLKIDPPKGVLLKGEPGTGKTHIIRSICNYYSVPLVTADAASLGGRYLGDTEANLRAIFASASVVSEHSATPCVLFIDEIDTLCPPRNTASLHESRVVGQLLTLMDGIKTRGRLVVVAATNRPNSIDPALRRPGRFDRELEVPVPNAKQRQSILQLYTRNMPLDPTLDLGSLADELTGYVGANIQALCRDASFFALKRFNLENKDKEEKELSNSFITLLDFQNSIRVNPPSLLLSQQMVETPNVTWDDIGGLEETKEELRRAIEWPLVHSDAFARLGLSAPKGILLYGPPGCSKTTLVKAIATTSKLSFISLSGATVFSPYLGDSEAIVRDVFKKARQAAPSILFFDEIDAIVAKRDSSGSSGDSAQSRVLSTFLNEMDGVEQLTGVIVVGATNRLDMIDAALLRPGRFDKILSISLPDQSTRKQIFKVKTKSIPIDSNLDFNYLSELTNGFSGADIENLCREASYQCLRKDMVNGIVSLDDFKFALKNHHNQ